MTTASAVPPANGAEPGAEAPANTSWPFVGGIPRRNWGWFLARGVLLIVLSSVALWAPGPALFAFAMVFAAFCFVDGVLAVVSGLRGARDSNERWWALVLSGLVGMAVGALFVLFPLVSTFAYAFATAILIAAWAVVTGLFEIVAAVRLRKEIAGEWLLGLSGAMSVLLGLGIGAMAAWLPGVTVLSVAWLIGVYALIAGVALVVLAFRLRKKPHEQTEVAPASAPAAT